MKIGIGIPTTDFVHTDFFISFVQMRDFTTQFYRNITTINERSCYIDRARNDIVKKALAEGCDYLLFLDSDMVFPSTTLIDLLQEQKPIIGCNYARRRSPFSPTATGMDARTIMPGRSGIEEVIIIPTGVMLINMAVIKAVSFPWFETCWNHSSGLQFGEDARFCAKAINAGHKVYCHHDLSKSVFHIGQKLYSFDDYQGDSHANKDMPVLQKATDAQG